MYSKCVVVIVSVLDLRVWDGSERGNVLNSFKFVNPKYYALCLKRVRFFLGVFIVVLLEVF